MQKYNCFREKYPVFVYKGFSYELVSLGNAPKNVVSDASCVVADGSGVEPTEKNVAAAGATAAKQNLLLKFNFEVLDKDNKLAFSFSPEWTVENRAFYSLNLENQDWKNRFCTILFNIGMAELVSYWKATASPRVKICLPSYINVDQDFERFWKKLYYHGLGEYFYLNQIEADEENFMLFEYAPAASAPAASAPAASHCVASYANSAATAPAAVPQNPATTAQPAASRPTIIVPIGGGKDSVCTWHILSQSGSDKPIPYVLNPRGATIESCRAAGYELDEVLVIRRSIDKELLRLNAEGFLNGHTPFSALLAFSTLLLSHLSGIENVALSNENSANESTVRGSKINHQYSKSYEFEADFTSYVRKILEIKYNYFSFLRPLSELMIAKVFSGIKDYHKVFKSCNVGSKTDVWCCNCAKCLFVYGILSPFLNQAELEEIFGENLFKKASLIPILKQLDGEEAVKAFECVGTLSEFNYAMQTNRELWQTSKGKYPILDHYFASKPSEEKTNYKELSTLCKEHNIPQKYFSILENYLRANKITE